MRKTSLILIIILSGLVAYNIFFGHSAVKEAKRLTEELENRVDSLKHVVEKYEKMEYKYARLYNELSQTRSKISEFKIHFDEINKLRANDVHKIKSRLKSVVADFDSLDIKFHHSNTFNNDLDSIRF